MYSYEESSNLQKNYIIKHHLQLMLDKRVNGYIRLSIRYILGHDKFQQVKYGKMFNKFLMAYPDDLCLPILESLMNLAAEYEHYEMAIIFRNDMTFVNEIIIEK